MKSRALIALASVALLVVPAAAANAEEAEAGPRLQTAAESLAEDLTLIAAARGWTYAEALAQYEAAEAVGALAEAVATEHPEAFVGSALSDKPGGAPTLYIKGIATSRISTLAAAADVPVVIADEQPYSYDELVARNDKLHDELVAMGYDNLMSAIDITSGTIEAEVERADEFATSGAAVRSALSEEFDNGVALTFTESLDAGFEHGYGGARVSGDGLCTSGWTVRSAGGTSGVTTAGHCDGMTSIREVNVGTWSLDFRVQHRGAYGDVEWHTVPGHSTPARFYSSANTLRPTNSIEHHSNISTGESVCVYGRSTNERDCSALVLRPGVTCTIDGVSTRRLVQMTEHVTTGGDSGGGWSHGNRAYGSHVGHCSGDSVFTPVSFFPDALSVSVKTT